MEAGEGLQCFASVVVGLSSDQDHEDGGEKDPDQDRAFYLLGEQCSGHDQAAEGDPRKGTGEVADGDEGGRGVLDEPRTDETDDGEESPDTCCDGVLQVEGNRVQYVLPQAREGDDEEEDPRDEDGS